MSRNLQTTIANRQGGYRFQSAWRLPLLFLFVLSLYSVHAQINVSFNVTQPTCFGLPNGSVVASANGGTAPYTYAWSTGVFGPVLNNITAGNYTVTVTDAASNSKVQSVTVNQPAIVTASITASNACSNPFTLTAVGGGGVAPYGYYWTGGQTSQTISVNAGTYCVTITDSKSCGAVSCITVNPQPLTLSATAIAVTCPNGQDGKVTANPVGGTAPYSYAWSNGGNTQMIQNLSPGTYSVTVTDANGCTAIASATVANKLPIVISITTVQPTCLTDVNGSLTAIVSGGNPPYTYLWNTGATTQTISNLGAGTYTVTVTDNKGCIATKTVVLEPKSKLTITATATNETCPDLNNGAATVVPANSTGPYTYAWSNGATTQTITNLAPGNYSVTVTDFFGCKANTTVTVNPAVDLTITINKTNSTICGGANGSATVVVTSGVAPYTYAWSNGANTATISNLGAGNYSVTVTDSRGCTVSGVTTITAPPPVFVSITATPTVCPGATTGTATAVVTGGVAPFTYAWSNGGNTVSISNLGAGTYSVTITDANGCTATASATINQSPAITININGASTVCSPNTGNATAAVVGGVPPYTFNWSNGATTQTIMGLGAGTYTVTVTDANGCTANKSITINVVTLTATITKQDVLCFGQNTGSATVAVVGGTMPYTYAWSNGANTATANNLLAGTYSVTVTDANGCTVTTSTTIIQPPNLVVTINATNLVCEGVNAGTATANATGGTPPYTYLWNTGATTQTISNLGAGTYTVTVTDANGCTKTASTTINLAPAIVLNIEATEIVCGPENAGEASVTVTGGKAPFTFLWSNGGNTNTIESLPSGTYKVTVTDANGCQAVAEAVIKVVSDFTISAVPRNVLCNGDNSGSILVAASGGSAPYSYVWNTGATGPEILNLVAGTYSVTVTDANGCSVSQSITITQPPLLVLTAVKTNVTCAGANDGTATATAVGGTAPYSFAWSNGQTGASLSNLVPGNYTVTVTDANFCTKTAAVSITQPNQLSVNINATNILCAGVNNGTATATVSGGTAPFSYTWSNGATTQTISGLAAGTYTVTVTDQNECSGTAMVTITQPTALQLNFTVNNIICTNQSIGTITALVTGGTMPYSYSWSNGATTATIANLPAGSYSLTVTDANGCQLTGNAGVAQLPNLTVSATKTDANCFGANDGTAMVVASGDAMPYTYAWSNGGNTATITGLAPGTYTVTVSSSNGCTGTASVTIAQPSALMLSTTKVDISCNGGADGQCSVTPSGGTPPYVYSWSNGASTANITGLSAGTYTVTVTDNNECQNTATVTINQPNPLTVSVSANNGTCQNASNGAATATPAGGTAPYTFKWNNNATTATISNIPSGIYTVTVTDAKGCTSSGSVTINNFPSPTCTATVTKDVGISGASDGEALATVSGGTPPYSFLWSNGQTTPQATGLRAGFYTVTITDGNGCTTTCSVELRAPAVIGDFVWLDVDRDGIQDPGEVGIPGVTVIVTGVTEDDPIYADTTTTDGNGYYLFEVPPPGSYKITFILPPGSTLVPTTQNAGSDDAKDSDADPIMLMTQVVSVIKGDTILTLDAGFHEKCVNLTNAGTIGYDQYLCGPGVDPAPIVEITPPSGGFGQIEYLWMMSTIGGPFNNTNWQPIPNSNTQNYDPGPVFETTYFIRCTRREDCPYIETNIVAVTVGNEVVAEINGPGVVCEDQQVTFTASNEGAGATYSWDFGLGAVPRYANTISATTTFVSFGSFEIKLSVKKGNCTSTAIKRVTVNGLCGGLVINADAVNEAEVMVTWAVSENSGEYNFVVEHSNDNQSFERIAVVSDPHHLAGGLRHYQYMDVSPKKGWNYYRVVAVEPSGREVQSDVAEVVVYAASELMHLYPNPVVDHVTLEIFDSLNDEVLLQVVNINGTVLQNVNVPANTPRQELDFSNLPSGTYFIKVKYGRIDVKVLKVLKP